jgi:hypothetical protein
VAGRRSLPVSRRAVLTVAAAVMVVAAGAAAWLVAAGRSDETRLDTVEPPSTTAGTTTVPTTTDPGPATSSTSSSESTTGSSTPSTEPPTGSGSLPAAGTPLAGDEVVAVIVRPQGSDPAEADLVVLSAGTGEELRPVATGFSMAEGGVYDLTLSPDRRTLLYAVAGSACTTSAWAVPVDGSAEPVQLSPQASAVAISPGGTLLALATGDLCGGPQQIEITFLDGTVVETIDLAGTAVTTGVQSIAFADDDTLWLAYYTDAQSTRLGRVDLGGGDFEPVELAELDSSYRAVERSTSGAVTAIRQGSADDPVLVELEGGAIARTVPLSAASARAGGLTGAGHVLIVSGDEDQTLTVDGSVVATGVADAVS